ncbi:MAG: ATP-binding cassette domain-containing protein, partial [Candidatus Phytoplasma stylosanthis]|nr:ATP-binding cassette domain-containing protein [Candidatus Phytoplasma stylosanthis]
LAVPIITTFTYFIMSIIAVIGFWLFKGVPSNSFLGKLGFVTIQLGTFKAFLQYNWRFSDTINNSSQIFIIVQSIKTAIARVNEFLYEYEEKEDQSNNFLYLDKVEGNVGFHNVSFGYYKDKFVIKNMNLFAKKNQTIAIVGSTGSGKTTLINLLTRFYDVDEGAITIDGVDIRNLKKENLRKIVGLVLQDIWLFKGTILENIKYGNPEKTDEEAIQMAKETQLHHFVMSKEKGYLTLINEELNNLSQGEKQLITITRTLLRDPAILIFDEATSTIDTQIESILQKSIQKIFKNKTSFIIAHRLSTIINADLIYVLKKGEIIEQGTHEELIAKKEFYYKLYQSQFQK